MTKAQIRAKYKLLRMLLSENDIREKSISIAEIVRGLNIWDKHFFHVFMPIEKLKEVDTNYLIKFLQSKGKSIVVSKSDFNTLKMSHYLLEDDTVFSKNKFNIPEPIDANIIDIDKIEVVFVPLLAFDKQGHRIGYGKGFYDRFLSKCNLNCVFIGLSFFEAEEDFVEIHDNDFKLHFCLLPEKAVRF